MPSTANKTGPNDAPPRPASSGACVAPSWNQVVSGPGTEGVVVATAGLSEPPVTAAPVEEERNKSGSSMEGSECETQADGSDNGNGNGSKKPAWNKPSNGAPVVSPVMGAVSWPTLSESTKASPKPLSPDSVKNPSDAPVSAPQVASAPAFSLPSSSFSAAQKQTTNNPNPGGRPARQRSFKRDGGGNSSSNGGIFSQPQQSSSLGEGSHDGNSSTKTGSGGSEVSGRDHGHGNAYRGGGDHPPQRGYRRSNSGPHSRGDGSFGGRRDQDRSNHDWNHHRSFNGRDAAAPSQRAGPRGFIRPPPGVAPYVPPPIRPYSSPIGIPPEMPPLYYFAPHPGMPFLPQMPPAVYFPLPDPQLHAKIINQIDYYFSNENLIKDTYLRRNMDENGWVPVHLISSFKKVTQLTTDIQLILDALRASTVVEVQGEKIRKRDDWMKWLMPPSVQLPRTNSSQSPRAPSPSQDSLAAHVQNLAIDEKNANQSSSKNHQQETTQSGESLSGL